jgi:hypothetical protein
MPVNKVTWKKVGEVRVRQIHVHFGWVTITAADLAIWELFPGATFALVQRVGATNEFTLGSFDPQPFQLDSRD